MMKNILNTLIVFLFLGLLVLVFLERNVVFESVSYSLKIWTATLIPTMFPFFVISDILISYHITQYIPSFIKNVFSKVFHVSENVVTIFFLSCISGFPSNARNTKNFYLQNLISREEAERALTFTHFSNPIFVLTVVGGTFFHNEIYGIIILISHVLGNILIGILFRGKSTPCKNYTTLKTKSQSFSQVFICSIKSSIDTLLLIAGTLTFFLIVSSLIIQLFSFSPYPGAIIKGGLEITMGLRELSYLGIADIYKVVIAAMFLSFGGLSVHLQVISQIVETDISYFPFFVFRLIHALLSGGCAYFLFHLMKILI